MPTVKLALPTKQWFIANESLGHDAVRWTEYCLTQLGFSLWLWFLASCGPRSGLDSAHEKPHEVSMAVSPSSNTKHLWLPLHWGQSITFPNVCRLLPQSDWCLPFSRPHPSATWMQSWVLMVPQRPGCPRQLQDVFQRPTLGQQKNQGQWVAASGWSIKRLLILRAGLCKQPVIINIVVDSKSASPITVYCLLRWGL